MRYAELTSSISGDGFAYVPGEILRGANETGDKEIGELVDRGMAEELSGDRAEQLAEARHGRIRDWPFKRKERPAPDDAGRAQKALDNLTRGPARR
jgi:hypothetical protein